MTSGSTLQPMPLRVLFDAGNASVEETAFPSEERLRRYCEVSLQAQDKVELQALDELELSVQLLESAAMQALNNEHRGKDTPTNVLSFASGMPVIPTGDDPHGGGLWVLGDLVLCADVVKQEASAQSKPLANHWAHMLVHGTLHLCGYDHESEVDAEAMESLEIQILSVLGIPDPYGIDDK